MTLLSSRHAARIAVTAAAVVALAGCGLRLETPPPEAPEPDAVEESRQEIAASAARLAATVRSLAPEEDEDLSAALERVEEDAEAHHEALGGVWVAWPEGVPDGSAEPDAPPTEALPGAEVEDLLELLLTGAEEARAAAVAAPDAELAALLGAVSLSRDLAADEVAEAAGLGLPEENAAEDADDVPAEARRSAPLTAETLLARGVDGPTVAVLDQVRFAQETAAARNIDGVRQSALERSQRFQALVDLAIAEGAPDERLAVYGTQGKVQGLSSQAAGVVVAETALAEHLLFSLGRAEETVRPDLLAAAADALETAAAWGAELPALPGLAHD